VIEVIIRPEAEADLAEAYKWYENQCQGLGADFLLCVEACIHNIRRNPRMYQIIHKNIHRALVSRFPYGIFYLLEEDEIIITAIFHVRRKPRIWQDRT
jgi:toxin ParE1/3/4